MRFYFSQKSRQKLFFFAFDGSANFQTIFLAETSSIIGRRISSFIPSISIISSGGWG